MIKINKINTKNVTLAFEKYGDKAVSDLKEITQITAQEIEAEAKRIAVVDNGDLQQNIRTSAIIKERGLGWKIAAYMPYSPFVEFGTGGLVEIPTEWKDLAARFRGKGIRQVNLPARPFMYPAFIRGKKIYLKDIKNALSMLTKKFNNG